MYLVYLPVNNAWAAVWSPHGDIKNGSFLKISSSKSVVRKFLVDFVRGARKAKALLSNPASERVRYVLDKPFRIDTAHDYVGKGLVYCRTLKATGERMAAKVGGMACRVCGQRLWARVVRIKK